MTARKHTRWLMALVAALSLTAAACGGGDDDAAADSSTDSAATGETDTAATEDLSGTINVSGSSTVEPITIKAAELFEDVAPDVVVNVDGPGTGDGFKLFCAGETDISDASRAIKDEEKAPVRRSRDQVHRNQDRLRRSHGDDEPEEHRRRVPLLR